MTQQDRSSLKEFSHERLEAMFDAAVHVGERYCDLAVKYAMDCRDLHKAIRRATYQLRAGRPAHALRTLEEAIKASERP